MPSLRFSTTVLLTLMLHVSIVSPSLANRGSCQCDSDGNCIAPDDGCRTSNGVSGFCKQLMGSKLCSCEAKKSTPPTPSQRVQGGEYGNVNAQSAAIFTLPVNLTITFQPSPPCVKYPPTAPLFGFTFNGDSAFVPRTGSMDVLMEPTDEGGIAHLSFTSLANLDHPPYFVGGHWIEVLSITPITSDVLCDLGRTVQNVYGHYVFAYTIRIDGGGFAATTPTGAARPVAASQIYTLYEHTLIVADFNAATGQWSNIGTSSTFTDTLPGASPAGVCAIGGVLALVGAWAVARRRVPGGVVVR